ncbi:MAG: hypothetical protein Q8N15_05060 [Bacillota bacterium]|nr:hypothetical protein [Bacillota bacterium]
MYLKKVFTTIALTAIAIGLFISCGSVSAEDTYVTLDINPSIDLTISGNDKVLDANALNEDGELLLLELDLIGETSADAIEMIIDKAIDLGFIDIEAAETLVSVSTISANAELGETVRTRIKEHIDEAFMNRGMMGKAVEKAFDGSTVAQAGALGVAPAQYNLAKRACELDDTLTIEEAVAMTPVELMARIKTMKQENKDISQALKDEFQAARDLIKDEYQPQIEALEAQIATLEGEGGDTAALEAELATLLDEFYAELELLRETYHEDSVELQTQTRTQYNARVSENAAAVEAWRTQTQTRKSELEDEIDAYQHGTENTGNVTTNQNTSGTGGN